MYPNNDYRNYLMHHGILGQRWGVRRYQNENGSLTSRGKDRYSKGKKIAKRVAIGLGITAGIAAVVGIGVAAANSNPGVIKDIKNQLKDVAESRLQDIHKAKFNADLEKKANIKMFETQGNMMANVVSGKQYAQRLSQVPLSEISGKHEIISKGQKLFRVAQLKSFEKTESLAGKEMLYINKSGKDHTRYIPLLNRFTEGQRSSLILRSKKDLLAPSERQRLITFMGLVNSNPLFKKALELDIGIPIDSKNSRRYYKYLVGQIGGQTPAAKMYINALKSRGFDAVSDDLDRGYFSKTATIIFNPENKVKIERVKKLTNGQLMKAAAAMTTKV